MTEHRRHCANAGPATAVKSCPAALPGLPGLHHPLSAPLIGQPLSGLHPCCQSLHNSSCHCPVNTAVEALARQPAQLGRRGRVHIFLIVVPKRYARLQAHLRNGLNAAIVCAGGAAYTSVTCYVVDNDRILVMASATG